jgi:hypothetical protein
MVTSSTAVGWFTDPFDLHEARWLSAGIATSLVRDGGVESFDPAPEAPAVAEAVPISWGAGAPDGEDLLRSDRPFSSARAELRHAANGILTRTHD